jgi:hypothetical protein
MPDAVRLTSQRRDPKIVWAYAPTPTSLSVFEVVVADELRVALRLIGGEVSDKSAIAERRGITV